MPKQQPNKDQLRICQAHGVDPLVPLANDKIGISLDSIKEEPLNGLRHRPEAGTSGWYIWGGTEFSDAPYFFEPLHHHHLPDYCPSAIPFLALPPGWRFLLAPGQIDVWYDPVLLGEDEMTSSQDGTCDLGRQHGSMESDK